MSISKYSIVIIEETSDYFLVRCGTCGGDGKYYGTCPVCNGAGSVLLRIPSSMKYKNFGLLRCGTCGGDGKYYGTCSVCNGVGVIVATFPRIICGTCGGDGRHYGTCSTCNGSGSVSIEGLNTY